MQENPTHVQRQINFSFSGIILTFPFGQESQILMKGNSSFVLMVLFVVVIFSCNTGGDPSERFDYGGRVSPVDTMYTLKASGETDPVHAAIRADAADDPAIWIHPDDPSKSFLLGSNKRGGISTYDLSGKELSFAPVGRINNIDVAYNITLAGQIIDICGGTNLSRNAIDLYKVNPEIGALEDVLDNTVVSEVSEVYGFCFYHSPWSSITYAILSGKDGTIEHYEILEGREKLGLKLVSSDHIYGRPEGLVADHRKGILYIGEENEGIWRKSAEPGHHEWILLETSTEEENPNIEHDIEGLAIYYASSGQGYLIASSQGNNSFAVYDCSGDNLYLGSFRIAEGRVDGTSETDGIDVLNMNLGPDFPNGLFIAHDDWNINGGVRFPQNYKLVDWKKVADAFDPPLTIDPEFNVRSLF
jgi:3-phytase